MRIVIGVSSCLLGNRVRYDASHKHDPFITETLGRWFEYVAVCPEAEVGMGTPRETVNLVGSPEQPRMVATKSGGDWTEAMRAFAQARVETLAGMGLRGYILKRASPSCGMERVKVRNDAGNPVGTSRGLFADALLRRLPLLPVEEEGRLQNPDLRENFIERVFAYHEWLEHRVDAPRELVGFHTRQKLRVMAHSPEAWRMLGRLVADAGLLPLDELRERYGTAYMQALRARATRGRHANALRHLAGYLKRALDDGDRAELAECIESYRIGAVPLVVPLTLLKHHFRRHPHDWVAQQAYLEPYPEELMLRNHV